MPEDADDRRHRARIRLIGLLFAAVSVGMVGMAYAAVPFYRAFCQATGFDGTARRGTGAPTTAAIDRTLTVSFDTNVRGMPWKFWPEQASEKVQIGAPAMAWFRVRNDSDQAITGRALYNVVPEAAAAYFVKTQCFCFNDETIPAHTEMRFPVIFYVEPGYVKDRDTNSFQEITLSYTYFPSRSANRAPGTPDPAAKVATLTAKKAPEGLGGTRTGGL
jgi:cytochrome c oxidase assembly protein subunit 11